MAFLYWNLLKLTHKQRQQEQSTMSNYSDFVDYSRDSHQQIKQLEVSFQAYKSTLQQQHKQYMESLSQLENKIIQEIEPNLEQQQSVLQLLQSDQSEQGLYTRARKMIELGADIEEIITECGITRAEAELIASMTSTDSQL